MLLRLDGVQSLWLLSPLLPAASLLPCVDEPVDAGEGPRKEDTRSKSGGSGMVKMKLGRE